MEFKFTQDPLEKIPADVALVVVFGNEGEKSSPISLRQTDGGLGLDKLLKQALSKIIREQAFTGKEGETILLNTLSQIKPKYIVVAGLGTAKNFSTETLRRVGGKSVQIANKIRAGSLAVVLESGNMQGKNLDNRLQAFVEGALLANYQFNRFKTKNNTNKKNTFQTFWFKHPGNSARLKKVCEEAYATVEGVNLARDLTNLPPNILTPTALGREAQDLAKKYKNISAKVFSPAEIKKEKMGALLAVAQGAKEPPAFIHLKYTPPQKSKLKVALVGKGITFDSGGLNIKTREMELMKMDMGGAAAVLGVFKILGELKPKVAVEGFIPSCENMPAGNAYRPSDIITTRSGKTVEITNTDAEGRLALADALDFALESKPDYMIDMATLTGGAAYALGELVTPVLGNDKKLVSRLIQAGEKAGEPAWELPIVQEYKKGYSKTPADIKNSGSGTRASTISGAIFLEEFVKKNKWAHMDIASTAWADEPTSIHPMIGATGSPVRTIFYFLNDLA